MVLGGLTPFKKNLVQAVLNSDVQSLEIVPSILASAEAVLSPKQKESGVALLDIGAGTTELAVFEDGDLVHLTVFPVGASNITNDIAIGLKTDIETAERAKTEFGSCLFKGKDKKEKIEAEDGSLVFSEKMLSKIIGARVCQIFRETQKELKKIQKQGMLPAGIVLTGGGAKIPRIVDLAKKEFKLPCRIGKPLGFSGQDNDPAFATAFGLVLKAASTEEGGVSVSSGKIKDKAKNFFKSLLP
jgi:cell division protein FtsA